MSAPDVDVTRLVVIACGTTKDAVHLACECSAAAIKRLIRAEAELIAIRRLAARKGLRLGDITARDCKVCGNPIPAHRQKNAIYCRSACKMRACRNRQALAETGEGSAL